MKEKNLIECGEIHIFLSSAFHNNIPKENHKKKQINTRFFDESTLQHGVLPDTISRIRLPRGLICPQQELPHVISSIQNRHTILLPNFHSTLLCL